MDTYDAVILLTLVGFIALAAMLLVPVYRFLKREERASQRWTPEALARQQRQQPPSANGHSEPTSPEHP